MQCSINETCVITSDFNFQVPIGSVLDLALIYPLIIMKLEIKNDVSRI